MASYFGLSKWTSEPKHEYKSTHLISLIDNNLVLQIDNTNDKEIKNEKIKVVSILGTARMGKSTLLNTIICKYTNNNTKIFDTSNAITHCTHGVDYVYIKEINTVFCDIQGLNSENSANDPKLLLIAYLMSDIIIFTEQKMLNKTTIQTLSPLSSFLTYMDYEQIKKKPNLIFRVSDYMLSDSIDDNLKQLLTEHEDQTKNTIINMKKLFNNIQAYKTNPLDRSELKMSEKGNYMGLLNSSENEFIDFINSFETNLTEIESSITINTWFNQLNEYIKMINSNKKIDFNKLDVYQLVAMNEILEYIDNLNISKPFIFTDMNVDHTEKSYIEIIKPRITEKNNIIKEFSHKFNIINENIKHEKYNKLITSIEKKIDNAIVKNRKLASTMIDYYCEKTFMKNKFIFTNLDIDKVAEYEKIIIDEYNKIYTFMEKNDINKYTITEYKQCYNLQFEKFKKYLDKIISIQYDDIKKIKDKIDIYLQKIIDIIKTDILQTHHTIELLDTKYEDIQTILIQKYRQDICNILQKLNMQCFTVKFNSKYKLKMNNYSTTTFDGDENYNDTNSQNTNVSVKECEKNNLEMDVFTYPVVQSILHNTMEKINEIMNNEGLQYYTIKTGQTIKLYGKLLTLETIKNKPNIKQLTANIANKNKHTFVYDNTDGFFKPKSLIKKTLHISKVFDNLIKNKIIIRSKFHNHPHTRGSSNLLCNGHNFSNYNSLFRYYILTHDNILTHNNVMTCDIEGIINMEIAKTQCIMRNYKTLSMKNIKSTKKLINE